MPGGPDPARMRPRTTCAPQLNWSSARNKPDRFDAPACMATVAPRTTARPVARSASPLAAASRMSLSHQLTDTAAAPATRVAPTTATDRRVPPRLANVGTRPAIRRASVMGAPRLQVEHLRGPAVGRQDVGVGPLLAGPTA